MKKQKEPLWLTIVRILLALVFIFSGLAKAIDPVASAIKFDEYFASFGLSFLHPFSMFCGFLLNIAEFTLGFALLLKIRVKLASLGFLLFNSFFLLLTLWLATAEHLEVKYGYNFGVVKDCGCFGQAIAMNNLETFIKNIVLMIPTLIVFAKRKSIPDIHLTVFAQWILGFIGAGAVIILQFYCLRNLPVIDFGDWKKGNEVISKYIEQPAEIEVLFLYQDENGTEKFLTMDEMNTITDTEPDFYSTFNFVDRVDSVIVEAIHPNVAGFSMLDTMGRDFASIYLNKNQENVLLVMMFDLDEVNPDGVNSDKLKKLTAYCAENKITLVGITNSPEIEIDAFKKLYTIEFPIYLNPIDPVKGPFIVRDAVRSNPGLIHLQKGVVANKWAWRNFPASL